MKKLLMLTAAAGVVLASAAPGLAAQRAYRASDAASNAYASGTIDRSGAYYYGPQDARAHGTVPVPFESAPAVQYNRGLSQPYADRPYGDPGHW